MFSKEESYNRHQAEEANMKCHFPSIVERPLSIDRISHQRMFDAFATKLVRTNPCASWLTIGDGRHGSDTIFLKNAGAQIVHTSSLTDLSLKEAKERGWIDSYSAENAESLSFPDNSFDFVLCKESYHHFPRPPIAFYEMLRVARIGVVFIEPYRARFSAFLFLKKAFKRLTGRKEFGEYEPCGNYIFRLSLNEFHNYARALNLPMIAYSFQNVIYHPILFKKEIASMVEKFVFYSAILFQDLLTKLLLLSPGLISCCVFKQELSPEVIGELKSEGVKFRALRRNPYV